ncbi:MAG TPA: tetratricopeptide repeat protein [Caulobacteraceae bacterium]|nr:tetratricopeptide repeat protein [Caulobacteraceae bacterium]
MSQSDSRASAGAPQNPVMMTLEQAFALAQQHLNAGRLADADRVCGDILRSRPDFAPALHLRGVVAYSAGDLDAAVGLVGQAVAADGGVALFHCNLGEMHRRAGRLDAALAAGRKALALDPDLPQALNNVGIVHYERGEYEEAVAHYRRATARAADYAEAWSNLGNALRALKAYDEALTAYGQALRLRPGFADALNNMGTALREMGRQDDAEAAYRQAQAMMPDSPAVLNNLALALKEKEQFDEAAALLTRSLAADPNNGRTLTYLALVRLEQARTADAEAAASRALALAPDDADALNAMGLVRFEQQDAQTALTLFRRAVALKPDLADAYNNIANVLKENGQLAEARQAYERAIELDPRQTAYYGNLADAQTFTKGDSRLAAMEALAGVPAGLSVMAQSRLNFALAKAYDDLGRYDEAFACMSRGNRLKRGQTSYDEAAALALFDRIRAVFDRRLMEAATAGCGSSLPVFIVGMPRSGTTLVEQILASHPQVHGAGELSEFSRLTTGLAGPAGEPFRYPEAAPALTPGQLRGLGEAYVEGLRRRAPAAARVTDKMPANFFFLGLIHMALPGARVVHVRRDPLDTCLSCYSKLFTAEQNFAYELGELGRYYRKYAELMDHWRETLPAGVLLEVRYEEVVADTEGQARRILDHCGLDWDPRCLAFHKTERPVRTASVAQVRRPIYDSAVSRWRRYERHLRPLRKALGMPGA